MAHSRPEWVCRPRGLQRSQCSEDKNRATSPPLSETGMILVGELLSRRVQRSDLQGLSCAAPPFSAIVTNWPTQTKDFRRRPKSLLKPRMTPFRVVQSTIRLGLRGAHEPSRASDDFRSATLSSAG